MAKCLIVDDEESYRKQLALILATHGHTAEAAADARDALAIAAHFYPQVLIADWKLMEDTNGLQVADAILATNPRMKVIVITGYATEALFREARAAGYQILEKPFELDEFIDAVSDALLQYEVHP